MRKIISSLILFLIVFSSKGQNVGIGTNNPHPSAKLEVSSNNSGFLPPRMTTTERNGINNPAVGLMIYNTTTDCVEVFGKGKWNSMFCVPIDSTTIIDSTLVTDIDGHTYPTVKICDQTWMAKNLDVARYRNGDPIPQVTDPTQWANLTTGAWCWYNNDSATYGSVYGRLYNWYAVNDPRGLAPTGWHVSSDEEWNILANCLGGTNDAGGKLKETGTTHWLSPNSGATNSSGFNALPAGNRDYPVGAFGNVGNNQNIWCSTETGLFLAKVRTIDSYNAELHQSSNTKPNGYSVRCVKDLPPPSTINDGLVAYYPFSGNAGDSSGNGNHGTVNGATLTTDRFGHSNSSYSTSSNNQFIKTQSVLQNISNTFTISLWANPQSTDIIIPEGVSGQEGYGLQSIIHPSHGANWGDQSLNAGVGINVGTNQIDITEHTHLFISSPLVYTPASNLTGWHNITLVYNSHVPSLYVDGILVKTGLTSSIQNIRPSNGFDSVYPSSGFGNSFTPNGTPLGQYIGSFDDIRIYNRALSQSEVTYLATH